MTTQAFSMKYSVTPVRRLVSVVLSVAAAGGVWRWHPQTMSVGDYGALLSTVASVSATLLGFLIAALAILSALVNRRLVMNMQRTGHYQQLTEELFISAAAYLLVLVVSMAAFLVIGDVFRFAIILTTAGLTFATLELLAAGMKFYRVMILLG